ncbi:MAG: FecR family protein [Pyrinomonadaceae bacterium]
MKTKLSRVFAVLFTVTAFVFSAFAQNNSIASAAGDKYIISAKAGGVNYVEGSVSIAKKQGRSGALLKSDKLEIGDKVSTGTDGKVEILLNPGSFLRLGANSSFEFKTTSLDDLQVSVSSGSAIFEVFAAEDFTVSVNVPNTKFNLVQSGIYRVDVASDGIGTIEVWKGKAELADAKNTVVKGGREASFAGGNATVAKFDRDDKDALENWSKARSKELSKVSGSFQRTQMRTALMQSFLGRQWNMYDSFGLWVFDPFGRNYCFLPFGYGWQSPYGYGFGSHVGWYNLPPVIYYPPPSNQKNTAGPARTGRAISAANQNPVWAAQQKIIPPFVRMEGDRTSKVGVPEPTFDNDPSPGPSSRPIMSAPVSVPIVTNTKPARP